MIRLKSCEFTWKLWGVVLKPPCSTKQVSKTSSGGSRVAVVATPAMTTSRLLRPLEFRVGTTRTGMMTVNRS